MMLLASGVRLGGIMLLLIALVTPLYACETIGSWSALEAAVQSATNTLSLCPFDISKPASGFLSLQKRLKMICTGATETNKCILRGTGHHFRIGGSEGEVELDGFAFHDATTCGVRVHSAATKLQTIRNCDFVK